MGVISSVGRIVLVVVNSLLLLVSLAMLVCGVIVVTGHDIYTSLVDQLEDKLQSMLQGAGLGDSVNTDNLSIADMLAPLAYGLIVLGVVIGVICLLGCCGGCYTIKVVLVIYAIVMLVFFIIQAIIVILIYGDSTSGTLHTTAKSYIRDTLDGYSGLEGTEPDTLAWNALMAYKGCCGVDGYTDFKDLAKWPPEEIFGNKLKNASINLNIELETPIMCCKKMPELNNFDLSTISTSLECAKKGTSDTTNNWRDTGCYDKLFDLVMNNDIVILGFALLLVFQFIMIFFSIWIVCTMDNKIGVM